MTAEGPLGGAREVRQRAPLYWVWSEAESNFGTAESRFQAGTAKRIRHVTQI